MIMSKRRQLHPIYHQEPVERRSEGEREVLARGSTLTLEEVKKRIEGIAARDLKKKKSGNGPGGVECGEA